MAVKSFNPTTPVLRWKTVADFSEITKKRPERSLTIPRKQSGGRNSYGRVTVRYRGGGHKQKIRIIDFRRDKREQPAEVIAIEYDPIRSARIALLRYQDGEKRYILHPIDLKVGDTVIASENAPIKPGNALSLERIPPGISIHNIELQPGKGGAIVRSAGSLAVIQAKEGRYAHVKLASGEARLIPLVCWATIGQVGNIEHETISIGGAGRNRHKGIRPHVRGVARNPVDHPMGGGEGKSSGGRHPCTPWGKITKGLKTRKHKSSDKYIVKRRGK